MATFKMAQCIFDLIYPIGTIYYSMNSTNPATLFGGTWTQIKDEFLYPTTKSNTTGGSATASIPAHNHTLGKGYAYFKVNSGNSYGGYLAYSDIKYTSNRRVYTSNSATYTDENMGEGVALGGNTDNNTAQNINITPKHRTCYAWYRTA